MSGTGFYSLNDPTNIVKALKEENNMSISYLLTYLHVCEQLAQRRTYRDVVGSFSLLEGQTTVTEPFRARSKTSCAGDVGGMSSMPDARRAVSRRLQALRAAAADPHRFVVHVIPSSAALTGAIIALSCDT